MSEALRRLEAAYAAHAAGDPAQAGRLVDAVLREAPDLARAWMLKGVLTGGADFPRQIANLEQAVALAPADAEAWYNLGVCLGHAGRWQAARTATRRALSLDPVYPEALANGCELERILGLHASALDLADRRLALGAAPWGVHLNRGLCLISLGRLAEAEPALAQAVALAPRIANVADLVRHAAAGRPEAEAKALLGRFARPAALGGGA
jgi:Flp pilus assembly protein TadD